MKITTIADYVDKVHEKYPKVPLSDIKKILRYGWNQFLSYNRLGCDINICTDEFYLLSGRIPIKRLKQYKLYQHKLARKLRVMFMKKHMKWDGYYYFCINRREYEEEYLPQVKKPEGIHERITFHNVKLYKLQDECKAQHTYPKYMFRVPYIADFGYCLFLKEYTPAKCELLGFIPAWKFHDLLITRNQYEILNGNYAKHV